MVLCQAILPRRATSITAPGTSPVSTYFWVTASMRASWLEDRPTSSGVTAMGRTGSAQLFRGGCKDKESRCAERANETVHPFLPFLLMPIFPPAGNNASELIALTSPWQNRLIVAGGLEIPGFR